MNEIGKNLDNAISNSKLTKLEISKLLGISKDTLTNYTKENNIPRLDILIKICELINVPLNEIVYGVDTKNINDVFISKFNKLTDEQKDRILEQIEFYENKNQISYTSGNTRDVIPNKHNTG